MYAALSPEKQAKQGEREKLAREHRATIALQVAELTLVLPPGAPKETQVTRDGVAVPAAALGVPVLVDPGEHLIKIQVPGAPASEMRLTLAPGEKKGVALDARQAGAAIPTVEIPPPSAALPSGGARNAGIIAGAAIAGASAIAGAIFTGLWASKGSSARSLAGQVPKNAPCPAGGIDNAVGTPCGDLVAALNTQATFGSAAVGTWVAAGAVGIVTLVSALVTAPRAPKAAFVVAPSVAPRRAGAGRGRVFLMELSYASGRLAGRAGGAGRGGRGGGRRVQRGLRVVRHVPAQRMLGVHRRRDDQQFQRHQQLRHGALRAWAIPPDGRDGPSATCARRLRERERTGRRQRGV